MKTSHAVKKAMDRLELANLRKHQITPIHEIMAGRDTLVIAPTASGKSAIFQVPALVLWEQCQSWTLVIEPTVSLLLDQVEKLNRMGIGADCISEYTPMKTSGPTYLTAEGYVQNIQITTPFLYVTPERLVNLKFRKAIAENPPGLVVVDEAHCVLEWGYTFRTAYLKIADFVAGLDPCPTIAAFTATAPPQYRKQICDRLQMRSPEIFVNPLERPNLILMREDCSDLTIQKRCAKVKYSIKKYGKTGKIVIYCATRKNVDLVCNYLSKQFPNQIAKCHAFMETAKRQKRELAFLHGKKRIMVATTAFGMGVDVADIRLVIHFNLPLCVSDYYQQVGRAGRDGQKAHAVLLYAPEDIALNRAIVCKDKYSETVKEWMYERIQTMADVAQCDTCMMQRILNVLGEEHPKNCRHCTVCQRKRRKNHET